MDFFYRYKSYYRSIGMGTPILDALIFRKMRGLVGGRIRLLLSGGAPLSPDIHDYVRCALTLPLVQGYGLTESCACGTIMDSVRETKIVKTLFQRRTGKFCKLKLQSRPDLDKEKKQLGGMFEGRAHAIYDNRIDAIR